MKTFKKLGVLSLSALTAISMTAAAVPADTAIRETSQEQNVYSVIFASSEKQSGQSLTAEQASELQTARLVFSRTYVAAAAKNRPYKVINNNRPTFRKSQLTTKSFERYSKLDSLGRCGTAFANVSKSTMPTEKRGAIGMIRPTGWHTVKYSNVPGKYLYNRCHLIAYELTAENANERNLITGTRYLNIEGMLPFENMVADYVKETGNHVLYKVKPKFKGNNLLASGVYMQAESVEDRGKGISFNIYCYNIQPGITINYADGSSSKNGKAGTSGQKKQTAKKTVKRKTEKKAGSAGGKSVYVYLSRTGTKYHRYSCGTLSRSKASRSVRKVKRSWAKKNGYTACKVCKP